MPTYFIHLENALKRANEFIEVQNKHRALEILCDVLHSKKHRTWQKKHEEIMMKYLELCVELKQSFVAKEGIYQYKIICQQSYISSFEEVIRKYIAMAEEKANQAKDESQAEIADIDDLENAQTPEDILMSAVSNEGNQDRKDRVVLIPWVKFLWESYRQCLDLLRHNNKTERLYHDIAHQAFKFCIKYNRKSEFRKLCDHLHLHLDQLKRQQLQQQTPQQVSNSINLSLPETQSMQLETRLIQLDYAIQLELWQEAYKATDDIKKFNLMNLNKKGFGKPQLIASYYQKLSLVFWKASSHLFHAAAQFRLFHLSKDLRKNLTQEDIQKMASRLVLAVLSIPIPAIRPEIDKLVDTEENVIDQHHRNLSMLLGITSKPPTRASLIKDLKRLGVLQYASPPIQELYQLLENEFNPMGICARVQAVIDYLEKTTADPAKQNELPDCLQYIQALKEVTIVRLIREVSQVYRTIEFDRLSQLCPFVSKVQLEKMVVESARRHDLQVKIDHRKGYFIFGTELRVSTGDEFVEGPYLQSMPNEQMRRQLVSMYSSLQKALHLIEPEQIRKQRDDLKRQTMKIYYQHAGEEHHRILNRQNIIEKRKEMIEQMGLQREMHERKRAEEEEARKRQEEEARLQEETKERERKKREKDEQDLMKQMTMDQLKKMKDAMPDLHLDDLDDEELAKLRPQDLHNKRVEQLEKERRDALARQRKFERKIDHFERAKRLEELPLLAQQYEEFRIEDRKRWEKYEALRIEAVKEERKVAIKERERFRHVLSDKEEFTRRVLETRQNEYLEQLAKFEALVAEERKKRMAVRREKRIEERRVRYNKEKEQQRLALQEEIQRKRLAEIEERVKAARTEVADSNKENEVRNGSWREEAPPSSTPSVGGGGMWRRKQAPVEESGDASELPPPIRPDRGARMLSDRNDGDSSDMMRSRIREPPMRSEEPPRPPIRESAADQASEWRRGPRPEGDEPPRRQPYSGRYSEGRSKMDDREGPPRPYGGRDSDRGEGRAPPSRPGYGGRDSRDGPRDGGRYRSDDRRRDDRDFSDRRGPPMDRSRMAPQTRADEGGSWRMARQERPPPEHDNDGSRRAPQPDDDGTEESDGWTKIHHSRKPQGNDRRGYGDRDGPPPHAYRGRDSRDRNEPPPGPRGPPRR
ncbi:Eukaryotic translation initiation factor 3 subunit A [Blomia tropicalis]|nr:Eukaryotic translation initiation factor 3 subunit A [Blomia tropicalis]